MKHTKTHTGSGFRHHPLPRGYRGLVALRVAAKLARRVRRLGFPVGTYAIKDQLQRAVDSCEANIAEGSGRTGGDRRYLFTVAHASVKEAQRWLLKAKLHGVALGSTCHLADRLGGLTFGLVRAESR